MIICKQKGERERKREDVLISFVDYELENSFLF